jgi:predicted dehydrogenase
MAALESSSTDPGDVSRREFLGSATLTAAGVATGLSFYFLRPRAPDFSDYEKNDDLQVRMGYIGVGNRGGSLLKSSVQAPGCLPVAIADIREAQRKDMITDLKRLSPMGKVRDQGYQVKEYSDYRRLLDDKDVEAVTVATPHYLHGTMAMDALQAGKHVYCEKAMAYTIEENIDLMNLARSKPGQVLQVGHQRRYSPLYQRVKQLASEDVLGDIVGIRAQWNQNNVERRPCPDPAMERIINWRLYSEFSGGLATEFASHQVDVANWLFGTHPDSVCGYGGIDWYRDGRDTTDNIFLLFNYKIPVLERDEFGRLKQGPDGKPLVQTKDGKPVTRESKFMYMSLMQNAHIGPSELVLGTKGTVEMCLSGGAEHFVEKKAEQDAERLAQALAEKEKGKGAAPKKPKSGATIVSSCLKRPKGEIVEVKAAEKDRWVKFATPPEGAYDTGETFLALGAFLDTVRAARAGKPYADILKADVEVGLLGAVPCLMANIAMRENRTVYWSEFFPNGEKA